MFATIILSLVVFGVLFLIIAKAIKDHKNHKGGCGCGCENCASAGLCHPQSPKQ